MENSEVKIEGAGNTRTNTRTAKKGGFIKKNWLKLLIGVVVLIGIIIGIVAIVNNSGEKKEEGGFEFTTILFLDDFESGIGDDWKAEMKDKSISEAKIESDRGFEGNSLVIYFYAPAENELTVTKSDGTELKYKIGISEDKVVSVDKL